MLGFKQAHLFAQLPVPHTVNDCNGVSDAAQVCKRNLRHFGYACHHVLTLRGIILPFSTLNQTPPAALGAELNCPALCFYPNKPAFCDAKIKN
jgi:hypothetical protein